MKYWDARKMKGKRGGGTSPSDKPRTSRGSDSMVWEDGGAIIPRWHRFAHGPRETCKRICRIQGAQQILPL